MFFIQDCFTNESNTLALKRDPKCASSDYSTSSDAFTKDKGIIYSLKFKQLLKKNVAIYF